MGMFDEIEYKGETYQTKDFECLMELYRVTDDGELQRELCRIEDTPQAEKPFPKSKPGQFEYFFGCQRKIHEGWETIPFHGIIRITHPEMYLKFTDGKLVGEIKEACDER